jgi:serine protease Do
MKQLLMTTLLLAPLAVSPAWSQAARAYVSTGGSYLGVGIRDVTSEDVEQLGLSHERGVYITDVQEGSPAEQVGIQEADVILGYSGVPVLSARQFQRMVGDTPRGREVEISLVRDRFTISVTPKVGSRRRGSSPHLDFFPHFEEEGGFRVAPFDRGKGRLSFSSRPRLGIRGEALTEQLADYFGVTQGEGVLITEVIEGTPAEEAALRAGDVIVSANGARVASVSDLSRQLGEDVVELEIVREQRVQTVTAELKQKKRQRKGSSIRL